PVAADAEPLQLLALGIDPVLGIGAALGAELLDRDLVLVELLLAVLLLDLPLDRKAMAIPPRHVGRILAEQGLRAHDHVLQHMVQRVPDMHVAVGVRRAIVEDELLAPFARRADLPIQTLLLPAREDARLLLRKARLHRTVGLRQEDRVSVIALFAHCRRALAAGEADCNLFTRSTRASGCSAACSVADQALH